MATMIRTESGAIVSTERTLVVKQCGRCGILFAVPKAFDDERWQDRQTFYCPNGHGRAYVESETDRVRRQKDAEIAQLRSYLDHVETVSNRRKRELTAAKGQLTKVKNRVGNGVCPCCNRTFQNLHRHMQSQHPEFKNAEDGTSGGV